jgi:hypothetical protein
VNKKNGENWCQRYLADKRLFEWFEKCDTDLAELCRQGGCLHCSGRLHRADYERKPRGGPEDGQSDPKPVYRDSFCCDQEGCRKRHTPPSVRFLGRKVYRGVVVLLVSAMRHGLKDEQVGALRESLGIDRRTMERWRSWWLKAFVQSPFWKVARARFMPLICEATLPWSLCQAFGLDDRDRLLDLLKFLSPITTASIPLETGFVKELIFPAENAR